ncbi:phosphoribosyltransferase-like protein [Aeromonas veronii]
MLKAGSKIIGYCQNPSRVMKPLGFSVFDGYGFGSVVFTYNNCPNNNPLAFWWGNPEANLYSPLRRWYPLMRRRTYE